MKPKICLELLHVAGVWAGLQLLCSCVEPPKAPAFLGRALAKLVFGTLRIFLIWVHEGPYI